MHKINCKCGEQEKNFHNNIGPFYIAECCEKAGFDHHGKKPEDYEREIEELSEQVLEESDHKPSGFDLMTVGKLMAYCDENKVYYTKRDNKTKLIDRIKSRQ